MNDIPNTFERSFHGTIGVSVRACLGLLRDVFYRRQVQGN